MRTSELNKNEVERTILSYVNSIDLNEITISRAVEMYVFKYEFYSEEVAKGHTRQLSEEEIERISIKNAIAWIVTKNPKKFYLPENPSPELVEICVNDILLEKGK